MALALSLALSPGGAVLASGEVHVCSGASATADDVLNMTDMDASGDIKNYDYQRNLTVTLDNTAWSGASLVWEADDWNAFRDYADGMDSVYRANLNAEKYNTCDEFAAAGGVYEIPAFDPNLVPD